MSMATNVMHINEPMGRVWGSAIGASLDPNSDSNSKETQSQENTESQSKSNDTAGATASASKEKEKGRERETPLDWRSPSRQPVGCREGLFSNRKRWEEDTPYFVFERSKPPRSSPLTRDSRSLESLFSPDPRESFFRGDVSPTGGVLAERNNGTDRLRSAFRVSSSSSSSSRFEFERERRFREPFVAKAYSRDFVWPVRSLPKTHGGTSSSRTHAPGHPKTKDEPPDVLGHSYNIQGRRDWRQAKVAARHLKFCPGEQCGVWLPLHCFCTNCNMEDGLDIYCIDCNVRRREEMNQKRKRVYGDNDLPLSRAEAQTHGEPDKTTTDTSTSTSTDQSHQIEGKGWRHQLVLDKYELFKDAHEKANPVDPREEAERARMREIKKRVLEAHTEAQKRFRVAVQVDPTEVSRRLFMRKKFVCTVTGEKLTAECFLDHHSITFELRDVEDDNKQVRQVMDIICSDCVTPLNYDL